MTVATGAFLNALGILLGAIFGLAQRAPLSARAQDFLRRALGAATVFFGLRLVWLNVNGAFWPCAKQMIIALLAIVLGNLAGKILRLQKISNRLGRSAGKLIARAQRNSSVVGQASSLSDGQDSRPTNAGGFNACAILFCAAPLGILGAVTDGLSGDFYLLAVKAAMDALAMTGFVKIFGWPSALSALPVYCFLGAITFTVQFYAQPFLDSHNLICSVDVAIGLIACAVALVIFEVRKVELANYLPALAVAPLLAKLLA